MLNFKNDQDIERLIENLNLGSPRKMNEPDFSDFLMEMVEEVLTEKQAQASGPKQFTLTEPEDAGSKAERAEQYLMDGILAAAGGFKWTKEGGVTPWAFSGQGYSKTLQASDNAKAKAAKTPKDKKKLDPELPLAKRMFEAGVKIGSLWKGNITAENTKVVGSGGASLSALYKGTGANPKSVTDLLIGGTKVTMKKAEGSQMTLLESKAYPKVFQVAYVAYKAAGGEIDLDVVVEKLGTPLEVLGISGADLHKNMVEKVLDDYRDAFDPKHFTQKYGPARPAERGGASAGGKVATAKHGADVLNTMFNLNPSKRAEAAGTKEAQQDLLTEMANQQAGELVPAMVEALREKFAALFEDDLFKIQMMKEMMTGAGKFKGGTDSPAVPEHILLVSFETGRFKLTSMTDDFYRKHLKHFKWNIRAGRGTVTQTIDGVRHWIERRSGTIRPETTDISKEMDDAIELAAKESGAAGGPTDPLQEGFLDNVKDFGKNMWSKIRAGFEKFKVWVSDIFKATTEAVGAFFAEQIEEPKDVIEKGFLELDVQFQPPDPEASLDNSIELD